MNIDRLHSEFGACITGVDLRETYKSSFVEQIHKAVDRFSFLWFPGQHLGDVEQLELTNQLGKPEPNHVIFGQQGVIDFFGTIGNVLEDGNVIGNKNKRTIFQTGNNMWHTDSSFREIPTYVSIMSVYEVPEEGGETEYACCRQAYSRLSEETKIKIEPLIAIHNYLFSRSKVSPDAVTPSHAASLPPVSQKLVRRNPRTRQKNYYIGSHAEKILGLSNSHSRELLDNLLFQATKEKYIYSHSWRPGDLVIWDNRCLIHRGTGYNADKFRRRMRQTRVKGATTTLEE